MATRAESVGLITESILLHAPASIARNAESTEPMKIIVEDAQHFGAMRFDGHVNVECLAG